MQAAQFSRFGGPEVLEIVDLPDPRPGADEVRIRVRAAGVNASDWKKWQGLMDQELPQTLGYEAAGVVDELGDGVTGVAVGDLVFGACPSGAAQAESAVLSDWAPIPDALDFTRCAAQQTGVRFSRGDTGRATYALALVAGLAVTGRFSIEVGRTFPWADVAEALRVGEAGTVRGKLVLLVD